MKMLIAVGVMALLVNACVSFEKKTSGRAPSGGPVTSVELEQAGPVAMLESLKNHCCNGVMVEKTNVSFWGEAEIVQLQKYVDDTSPAAPVYRMSSPVMCLGPRFVSTVGHEARHFIAAIKKGVYPLAQCSTYDLQLAE